MRSTVVRDSDPALHPEPVAVELPLWLQKQQLQLQCRLRTERSRLDLCAMHSNKLNAELCNA
jgi:hypothetical protein